MLPGKCRQLVANVAAFAALMESGQVWTWGDARYRSLGRSIVATGMGTGAEEAGLVEAVGGIEVRGIAAGGWMMGAVSEDGAGYLWGAGMPGAGGTVGVLKGLEVGEAALLDIKGEDGEMLDVLDVAVGGGHVVVLCEGGKVFAAGENRNGQLGFQDGEKFCEDWTEIVKEGALSVIAGPKCTLVRTKEDIASASAPKIPDQ